MHITGLYAALLAPLFLLLSVRVIRGRRGEAAALGDAGDKALLRRIRVHANFAEYVPFALILIGLAEGMGMPPMLIHALGLSLLAGRLSHAYGVSQEPETFAFRITGMALTFGAVGLAAVACFVGAIR